MLDHQWAGVSTDVNILRTHKIESLWPCGPGHMWPHPSRGVDIHVASMKDHLLNWCGQQYALIHPGMTANHHYFTTSEKACSDILRVCQTSCVVWFAWNTLGNKPSLSFLDFFFFFLFPTELCRSLSLSRLESQSRSPSYGSPSLCNHLKQLTIHR